MTRLYYDEVDFFLTQQRIHKMYKKRASWTQIPILDTRRYDLRLLSYCFNFYYYFNFDFIDIHLIYCY